MNIDWSVDQRQLYTQYSDVGREIALNRDRNNVAAGFDRDGWRILADSGFWKIPIPISQGGSGMGWWDFVAAMEGLAGSVGDLGFLLSIVAHAGALRIISIQGSSRQIDRWMPVLLAGGVASTAITEERGGSDVARVELSMFHEPGRSVLRGKKSHITNAPVADLIVAVGRDLALPEKRNITLFLIDAHNPSVEVADPEMMLGNSTSPTGDIEFNNVEIDAIAVFGKSGDGLSILYNMISFDRLLYGLISAAFSDGMLRGALDFTSRREAFGKSIDNFQYVQDKLVSMKINMEVSRYISYAAMQKLIDESPDAILMCSIAKLVGTEGLWESAQNLMQLNGHSGYMLGKISRIHCDVAGTRIAGGTSDIQKVNIFNQLKKCVREG
ncbi:acyl-CoA dehydrogenase family protein [Burkholderia sp. LMG 21824]|uniref:acyl-CoA dehydrogenase family protein n=1 Tax=Burkholderia sp. LMG 21824 TaxID=3158172 RepID=UPI003C30980C